MNIIRYFSLKHEMWTSFQDTNGKVYSWIFSNRQKAKLIKLSPIWIILWFAFAKQNLFYCVIYRNQLTGDEMDFSIYFFYLTAFLGRSCKLHYVRLHAIYFGSPRIKRKFLQPKKFGCFPRAIKVVKTYFIQVSRIIRILLNETL